MKEVSDIIKQGGSNITVSPQKRLSIPKEDPRYRTMNLQGGGTDGSFAYYIMNEHGKTSDLKSKILKVDLESWQIVGEGNGLILSHANDITYDTRHHRLVVAHCQPDRSAVSFIDPDTLEITETRNIPTGGQYSICYSDERGLYAIGKSLCYDIGILDEDFNLIATHPGEKGYTKQGMECDKDHIYFLQSDKTCNWIFYYDWAGSFLGKIKLPMLGEAENLFIRGNRLIAAFNNGTDKTGDIYEISLSINEADCVT